MAWTLIVILIILWALGLIGNIGGGLIHLLLVVALVVFIYNMVAGRRHPV
ncbi:MAG: family rane protein [Candidatus Saccharibacteria bacterium]|nr:family rane protein [Candidatus Saccharibacteria bacterium]